MEIETNDPFGTRARALVVGASSRIGRAVVAELETRGLDVVATYHRHAPVDGSPGTKWHALDVTSQTSIDALTQEISSSGQGLDVIVMAAGLLRGKPLDCYDLEAVDEVMRVNFSGPASVIASVLPFLNDGSCVVMFSSVSGERGSYDPIYAASKGAIISLVKSLATRLAPKTRFVAIAPGLVEDSGMYSEMKPERQAFHRDAVPVGRLITPQEIARIVFDLTQDHWTHANGSCVRINGGSYV